MNSALLKPTWAPAELMEPPAMELLRREKSELNLWNPGKGLGEPSATQKISFTEKTAAINAGNVEPLKSSCAQHSGMCPAHTFQGF